jgi:hypothetical protein
MQVVLALVGIVQMGFVFSEAHVVGAIAFLGWAFLRVGASHRLADWRKHLPWRIIGKQKAYHRSVLASSTRSLADFFESSTTHVQRVRDSVALGIWYAQIQFLSELPPARHVTLLLAFDESSVPVKVEKHEEIQSLIMIHATVLWYPRSGEVQRAELCIPPGCLHFTSALRLVSCRLGMAACVS